MGTMIVRPDDVARLRTPILAQVAATCAEDGCHYYALAHDLLDPATIHVAERWRDQAAMARHLVSDQMVRFNLDFRAAQMIAARVLSFHPGGEVRKLIDYKWPLAAFAKENPSMVIVMGTARLATGEVDRLIETLRTQIEATRAEEGCEHYSFSRDLTDPDLLHIAERWRDNAALAAHFASPHMAAFNAAFAQAQVLGLDIKAYDENGARQLMGG